MTNRQFLVIVSIVFNVTLVWSQTPIPNTDLSSEGIVRVPSKNKFQPGSYIVNGQEISYYQLVDELSESSDYEISRLAKKHQASRSISVGVYVSAHVSALVAGLGLFGFLPEQYTRIGLAGFGASLAVGYLSHAYYGNDNLSRAIERYNLLVKPQSSLQLYLPISMSF